MNNVNLYLLNEGEESLILKEIERNISHENCKNEAIKTEEFGSKIMDMFDTVGVTEYI
jgi:hypothetical protein